MSLTASVVIVTADRPREVQRCLESVVPQLEERHDAMVVDASKDDATEKVVAAFPSVRYLRSPVRNLCAQRNLGIRASQKDVVAFIDDDAVAHDGWLQEILAPYADAKVSSVVGAVRQTDLPIVPADRGPMMSNMGWYQTVVNWQQPTIKEVPNGQGNNMSFRKSALAQIDLWDETLHGGCHSGEDVDVFVRLRRMGGKILYNPNAVITHLPGPTFGYKRSQFNRHYMFWTGYNEAYGCVKLFALRAPFFWYFGYDTVRFLLKQIVRLLRAAFNPTVVFAFQVAGRVCGFCCGIRWHLRHGKTLRRLPPPTLAENRVPQTVAAIIVTADRPNELRNCLQALTRETPANCELLVVDSSRDDQTKNVVSEFPRVRYIRSAVRNMCAQRNLGIRSTDKDIVAFLDDDATPQSGWWAAILDGYREPNVSSVVGAVVEDDLPSYPSDAFRSMGVYGNCNPITNWQMNEKVEVFNGRGCNMSFRRAILQCIGGFDENYRMNCYGEEMDVFVRLKRAGGKVLYHPNAKVIHRPSTAAGLQRSRHNRHFMFWVGRNNAYGNTKLFLWRKEFFWYHSIHLLRQLSQQLTNLLEGVVNNLAVTAYHLVGRAYGFFTGLRWHLIRKSPPQSIAQPAESQSAPVTR